MDPDMLLMVFYMCLMGAAIGSVSGLIPGIHVNTLSMILLAFSAPLLAAVSLFVPWEQAPVMLACCIMSAAVVHSMVSFVPSAFIGIPDTESVMSVLPAHRMVLEGDGMVAVRCAAVGSLTGAIVSLIIAVPLYLLLKNGLGDYLNGIIMGVLIIVLALMILGESGIHRLYAAVVIIASGAAGLVAMLEILPMETIAGIGPETMFPLLTGLFGIPSLLWQGDAEIPPQYDDEVLPVSPLSGVKGVLTGCVTGWFPGITSTAGAMIAGRIFGNGDIRDFIAMVSSIGTASAMFAFITLSLTGKERSGTMSAINSLVEGTDISLGSTTFACILISMAVAAVLGYIITIWSGKRVSVLAERIDMRLFNRIILVLMVVLTILFCGYWGLVLLAACTIIGMAPLLLGIRRIHLTGCLIVPVLLFKLGLF